MPTTRRSSGTNGATGKQSTLSFNHRVTKSGPKQSAKDNLSKSITSTPVKASPLSKQLEVEEAVKDKVAPDVVEIAEPQEEDDVAPEQSKVVEKKVEAIQSEAEVKAIGITDREVEMYWMDVESQRIAKRVHQEDLSVAEKVLRYFDVSSQYGPCIGITRRKRWERAEKLGLEPPVEVLAVLLKGGEGQKQKKKNVGVVREMAHMDDILNSTAVGAS